MRGVHKIARGIRNKARGVRFSSKTRENIQHTPPPLRTAVTQHKSRSSWINFSQIIQRKPIQAISHSNHTLLKINRYYINQLS